MDVWPEIRVKNDTLMFFDTLVEIMELKVGDLRVVLDFKKQELKKLKADIDIETKRKDDELNGASGYVVGDIGARIQLFIGDTDVKIKAVEAGVNIKMNEIRDVELEVDGAKKSPKKEIT